MSLFANSGQDVVQAFCTKESSKQDVASGVELDNSYLLFAPAGLRNACGVWHGRREKGKKKTLRRALLSFDDELWSLVLGLWPSDL